MTFLCGGLVALDAVAAAWALAPWRCWRYWPEDRVIAIVAALPPLVAAGARLATDARSKHLTAAAATAGPIAGGGAGTGGATGSSAATTWR
jgi:hypothetical protein